MHQRILHLSLILLMVFVFACGEENTVTAPGSRTLSISIIPGPQITDLRRKQGYWTAPFGPCSVTVSAFDSMQGIRCVTLYNGSNCLGSSVDAPHVFTFPVSESTPEIFSVRAYATNAAGQTLFTAPVYIRTYSREKNGPHMNSDGSCTFLIQPSRLLPAAVGHSIYLAGDMNSWGGRSSYYRKVNMLTNRGDGVYALTITNLLPGDEYKFNIDYNDDGVRDDTRDWNMDPANPVNLTNWVGTENSVVPSTISVF